MTRPNRTISLFIGCVNVCIETNESWIIDTVKEKYSYFIAAGRSDYFLNVRSVESHLDNEEYKNPKIWITDDALRGKRGDFSVELDLKKPMAKGRILHGSRTGLDTVIKFAFVASAIRKNGFFIHAAATEYNNIGWLFPGKSGAGKTTLAEEMKSHRILTDEMALILKYDNNWYVYGSPFSAAHSDENSANGAPVGAVIYIRKSKRLALETLESSFGAFELLKHIIGWKMEYFKDKVLDFIADFSLKCPFYRLDYALDSNVNEMWDRWIEKNH